MKVGINEGVDQCTDGEQGDDDMTDDQESPTQCDRVGYSHHEALKKAERL